MTRYVCTPIATMMMVMMMILALIPRGAHSQSVAWNWTVPWATSFGDPYVYQTFLPTSTAPQWLVVVFASSSNASALLALHADTGDLVWSISPAQVFPVAAYSGWCDGLDRVEGGGAGARSGSKVLYCGLDDGVVAVDGATGDLIWRYHAPSISGVVPNAAAPAHPTAVATPKDAYLGYLGFIVFTFENGANSSALYAVRADTGTLLTITQGERVFTKIWSVAATVPGGVALCSVTDTGNISVSVRVLVTPSRSTDAPYLRVQWMHADLPFSPPGIWDNPNLDVDAAALTVFMYEKSRIGSRSVIQFDSVTGQILWTLPTAGHVVDYDTFAYQNNFYRLVTTNDTSGNGITLEAYNVSVAQKGDGGRFLQVRTQCDDPNAILLVSGPLVATPSAQTEAVMFVVGLNTGTLWLVANGALQWSLSGLPQLSTAILGPRGDTVMVGVGGTASFVCFHLQ